MSFVAQFKSVVNDRAQDGARLEKNFGRVVPSQPQPHDSCGRFKGEASPSSVEVCSCRPSSFVPFANLMRVPTDLWSALQRLAIRNRPPQSKSLIPPSARIS